MKKFWDSVHFELYECTEKFLEADRLTIGDSNYFGEYAIDIHEHMMKEELARAVKTNFMDTQKVVNYKMRSMLINWLVDIHFKFKLDE